MSVQNVEVRTVGLEIGSPLLESLKQVVVQLASSSGVLDTIQSAAQAALQAGWSILLPTADERAKTLSSLLPSTGLLPLSCIYLLFALTIVLILMRLVLF